MARVGDIFAVQDGQAIVGLLHYVGADATQLHSHVVRAYRCPGVPMERGELNRITAEPPDFCAHVAIPVGLKRAVFISAGKVPLLTPCSTWFRQANDYGNQRATSSDWSVWRMGEPMTRVTRLSPEQREYELGLVVNPFDVVHRLRVGQYAFFYPEPM